MNSQLESGTVTPLLSSLFEQQRSAYQVAPYASAEDRIVKLKRLKKVLATVQ